MPRYSLRTLLIVLALGPTVLDTGFSQDWIEVKSAQGNLQMLFPAPVEEGKVTHVLVRHFYRAKADEQQFEANYYDRPDGLDQERFAADILAYEVNPKGGPNWKVSKHFPLTLQGHPGHEAQWTYNHNTEPTVFVRYYLLRSRIWTLKCGSENRAVPREKRERFFNSFRILNP